MSKDNFASIMKAYNAAVAKPEIEKAKCVSKTPCTKAVVNEDDEKDNNVKEVVGDAVKQDKGIVAQVAQKTVEPEETELTAVEPENKGEEEVVAGEPEVKTSENEADKKEVEDDKAEKEDNEKENTIVSDENVGAFDKLYSSILSKLGKGETGVAGEKDAKIILGDTNKTGDADTNTEEDEVEAS